MNDAIQQAGKIRSYTLYAVLLIGGGMLVQLLTTYISLSRVFDAITLFGTGDPNVISSTLSAAKYVYAIGTVVVSAGCLYSFAAWHALRGANLSRRVAGVVAVSAWAALITLGLALVAFAIELAFGFDLLGMKYALLESVLLFLACRAAWRCREETGSPLLSAAAILDSDAGADDPAIRVKGVQS